MPQTTPAAWAPPPCGASQPHRGAAPSPSRCALSTGPPPPPTKAVTPLPFLGPLHSPAISVFKRGKSNLITTHFYSSRGFPSAAGLLFAFPSSLLLHEDNIIMSSAQVKTCWPRKATRPPKVIHPHSPGHARGPASQLQPGAGGPQDTSLRIGASNCWRESPLLPGSNRSEADVSVMSCLSKEASCELRETRGGQ